MALGPAERKPEVGSEIVPLFIRLSAFESSTIAQRRGPPTKYIESGWKRVPTTMSAVVEPVEHAVEVGRVVLAVGIDLHQGVVALALGVEEGRAHGPADADVERQRHDGRPRLLGESRRCRRSSRR